MEKTADEIFEGVIESVKKLSNADQIKFVEHLRAMPPMSEVFDEFPELQQQYVSTMAVLRARPTTV